MDYRMPPATHCWPPATSSEIVSKSLISTMEAAELYDGEEIKQSSSTNNGSSSSSSRSRSSENLRWQCAASAALPRRPIHHRQRSNRWRSSSDLDMDSTPAPPCQRRVPKCESLPIFPTHYSHDNLGSSLSQDADHAPRRPCRRGSIGKPSNPENVFNQEAYCRRELMAKSKYVAEFSSRKSLLSKSSSSISELSFTSFFSTEHQDFTSVFSMDEAVGSRKDISQYSGSYAGLNDSNNLLDVNSPGNLLLALDEKINHSHVKAYRRCMTYKSKSFTRRSSRAPLIKSASMDDVLSFPKTDDKKNACPGRRTRSLDRYEEKECLFQEVFSISELQDSFVSLQPEVNALNNS